MVKPDPLRLRELVFARQNQSILNRIDLTIAPAQITCLIGPNGSGKSTLLRCVAGSLQPESGSISCGAIELTKASAIARAQIVAYAPQETVYPFAFTVQEFLGISSLAGNEADLLATQSRYLERLDLSGLAGRSLLTLSGGERQRAAIARALLQRSAFVLLDEPTAHLDIQHQKLLIETLREEVKETGRGVLVVLHDLNLATLAADRLALLSQGSIVATGTPREVVTQQNIQQVYKTEVQILNTGVAQPIVLLTS